MASCASIEQCSFTGGSDNSFAISTFVILRASSIDLPISMTVTRDELAIAEPQPNVLNFASVIFPFASTRICSFMTSPHAGAPTKPVPTSSAFLSSDPTFRGFR
eukprot:Opistho-2@19676